MQVPTLLGDDDDDEEEEGDPHMRRRHLRDYYRKKIENLVANKSKRRQFFDQIKSIKDNRLS